MSDKSNKAGELILELIGSERDQFSLNNDDDHFEIQKSYNLGSAVRGKFDQVRTPIKHDTLIQITTEDSFEWIGNHEDITEINAVKKKYGRNGNSSLTVTNRIVTTTSSSRSFQGTVENVGIDLIVRKGATITAGKLGELIDKKMMPEPGLYGVDQFLKLTRNPEFRPNTKYLLLLHGTFSSTEGSFGDLRGSKWESIYSSYSERVLTLDHFTVSKSPGSNVLTLLEELPENVELDIMTTSRGGLVADLLARCDKRVTGNPFTDSEISFMESSADGESFAEEMLNINAKARNKNIQINKIVRVACPASGTVLLDKRLDHFLNFILNAVHVALGGPTNLIYRAIKTFLLEVVKNRHKAEAFPGLWSMVPQSSYQKINNGKFVLPSSIVAVAGDSKVGGGIWNSIKVIMTNLYYLQDNDFVVNTKAMSRGLRDRANFYTVSFTSSKINHFKYFEYEKSAEIIAQSLLRPLDQVSGLSLRSITGERGFFKDLIKLNEIKTSNKVDTNRPVVVLLPGIMGSCLHHNNKLMWVSGKEIGNGALANHLQIDEVGVSSNSAIALFYRKFKKYYEENGFHVVIASFDWRKSVVDAAKDFDKLMQSTMNDSRESNIVSHSMGGLVVREWKNMYPDSWKRFKAINRSKWIMLGTPWLGSYLIMEVLTGHAKRLKQLAWLDETDISRKEIIKIIAKFPGVLELLPIWDNADDFSSEQFWKEIQEKVGKKCMPILLAKARNHYKSFREKYQDSGIEDEDRDKIFYIAGHKDRTVNGYKYDGEFKYSKTFRGDGSVTWDSGIPKNLRSEHLFYSHISHSDLANKHIIFRSIKDILFKGTTDELASSEVGLRLRGEILQEEEKFYTEEVVDYYDEDLQIYNLFDLDIENDTIITKEILHVNVFNADLKWANSPVMVGHFENDSIVSAEQAIDRYLNGKLSERMTIASYPGKIGEQTVVFAPDSSPKGAIVIGLGPKDELTGYELARTVTKGIVKYAILLRDSLSDTYSAIEKDAISTLLVASGYGKLSKEESIRSIILGIHNANEVIGKLNTNLTKIKYLEFVDYYEDKAYECYKILSELQEEKNQISIKLKDDIEHGFGSRKRFLRRESSSWWHSLTTVMKEEEVIKDEKLVKKDPYLQFSSYSGLSSVSVKDVRSNLLLAEYITKNMSLSSEWNKRDSKTVFELLLPNAYKDFVRNHRNIEWKMDVFAAQFPWEMFHDTNYGEKPTFVESGIIRQLFSTEAIVNPMLVNNNRALVIGDPVYNMKELPQLDGALLEAKKVVELLRMNEIEVEARLRSTPMEIIKSLLAEEYKVLHIAGHGLYDPENGKVGIAIGDGQFLTPGTITQMTAIPEFVFINCCFGGKVVKDDERYSQNRHKLAANVGTEFIKIGAKAVVVAGWEIDDKAALVFAQEFYRHMYNGAIFGYAIQRARNTVYEQFKKTNTWGAYQCYGDQFYRLARKNSYDDRLENITLEREIVLELHNLLSSTRSLELAGGTTVEPLFKLKDRVRKLIDRAKEIDKYSSRVMINEVEIYINLGHYENAIAVLENLRITENDAFTFTLFDRYFNIQSKEIIRNYFLGNGKRKHKAEMNELISNLDSFSADVFGKSYNKHNSTGSTYKRAGILLEEKRKEYFEKAAQEYLNAGLSKGLMHRNAIYPVTSFITLTFLHNKDKAKFNRDVKKALDKTALQYLSKKDKDIEKEIVNRSDVWDQLAEIQLKVCRMVIQDDDLEELYEQIVDLYKLQIRKCINMKDLIGEIEHMEFLNNLHPDKKTKKLFGKLKAILRSYLGLT